MLALLQKICEHSTATRLVYDNDNLPVMRVDVV